ncbi:MAG: hypothetical protein U9P71_09360 [Campylobacterota bacterium]|nr:hypothetical protein [Campylobacterota bacterium]
MKKIIFLLLASILLDAKDYTILVAPPKSEAYSIAKERVITHQYNAFSNISDALVYAAKLLNRGHDDKVTLKISEGVYSGHKGYWKIPPISNAKASLIISGGYEKHFKESNAFDTQSILNVTGNHSHSIIQLEGSRNKLKQLSISGLIIDAAPSNSYAVDGSLLKYRSRTTPILAFGYLETEALFITDNVLMNSAHMALAPLIRAANENAYVVIKNNFFVNNVYALKIDAANFRNRPYRYLLINNTFVSNLPYNFDTTSSTVATVEIASKSSSPSNIIIANNIFAHNASAAIAPLYKESRMANITIHNNNFFNNATLFHQSKQSSGAMIIKDNATGKYINYDIETMKKTFSYDIANNYALDPKIMLPKTVNQNLATKMPLNVERLFSKNPKLTKLGVRKVLATK